jgi:tetratricopeptide (TPR) repeat protein
VTFEVREAIGQNLAIALLAGLRGVVADFLWIQSHSFWEKREWLRQYRNIEIVVTLQPQAVMFWDLGQWHIAWNMGYGARSDPKNRTQAEGIKREREWHEKARAFLERGIENIPNRYDLYFMMGFLYYEKFQKHCDEPPCTEAYCKAVEYFRKASSFPDAPQFVPRVYARALEKCGDYGAAYDEWKRLWFQDRSKVEQAWSIIEREIRQLEDRLKVPDNERVFPTHQQ